MVDAESDVSLAAHTPALRGLTLKQKKRSFAQNQPDEVPIEKLELPRH